MPAQPRPQPRPQGLPVRPGSSASRPAASPKAETEIAPVPTRPQPAAGSAVRPATTRSTAAKPVTRQVVKPAAAPLPPARPAPTFAEDADESHPHEAPVRATGPIHASQTQVHQAGRRARMVGMVAAVLGVLFFITLVLWIVAFLDASRSARLLERANEEATAKRGELERSAYDAHLGRVRMGVVMLAYAVDQLDASRVAGMLKGGGIGALKEASEALGAVAHAQTGFSEKVLADIRSAHGKMKELKEVKALDQAILAVTAVGDEVAKLQTKALQGLEESQMDGFATAIQKVRADFAKAYQELREIARF